jgi:hypothetical protein
MGAASVGGGVAAKVKTAPGGRRKPRRRKQRSVRRSGREPRARAAKSNVDDAKSTLSERHLANLADSWIDPKTATVHEFRTVTKWQELAAVGFPEKQAKRLAKHLPGLLIPSWGANGKIAGYQVRFDHPPLVGGKGRKRPLRYAGPEGATNVLDFGPDVDVKDLGDPRCPVFIVEGVKKAVALRRALASKETRAIVIAITGVFGWKHTNDRGGKAAHPDLSSGALAFNDNRLVLIIFDSDVWSTEPKAEASRGVPAYAARNAAEGLAKLLRTRGALAKFVILPPREDGGKQGVDDFLVAGGGLGDLEAFVADVPPEKQDEATAEVRPRYPYFESDGSTYYMKVTERGQFPVLLANFTARIEREVQLDDGVERTTQFDMLLQCQGRTKRESIPAARFPGFSWVALADAIISPSNTSRDHLRAAVQHLSSDDLEKRTAYAHTGWRELDGIGWVFLHAGGAIGPLGPVPGVECRLEHLPNYVLPAPPVGEALVHAVKASLRLLDLAPLRVTAPLLAGTYRAPIGETTAAVFFVGTTGRLKTELLACSAQHFGPAMNAQHLPGSWESTENHLEAQAFLAKDVPLPIDDFCPRGSAIEHSRYHAKASRIFRATGNHSSRGRMRADRSLDPARPPRCLVMATGEDVPKGGSIRARMAIVEVAQDDVKLGRLTPCQADASAGLFAAAMAGYVSWLAGRLDEVRARHAKVVCELRAAARSEGSHLRAPAIVAELAAGIGWLLEFAVSIGAIEVAAARERFAEAWKALLQGSRSSARYLDDVDAATRYLDLLSAAIVAGEAHLADAASGGTPPEPASHGWRRAEVEPLRSGRWVVPPSSRCVGWVTNEEVWLLPDAAFGVVSAYSQRQGEAFSVGQTAIGKRLEEAGRLRRVEIDSDGSVRHACRETVEAIGKRARVLILGPISSWVSGPTGPIAEKATSAHEISWPGFAPEAAAHFRSSGNASGPQPGPETCSASDAVSGPGGARQMLKEDRRDESCGPVGPVSPGGEPPAEDDEPLRAVINPGEPERIDPPRGADEVVS